MTAENQCPHCGKTVPPTALGGICPECMLKAGLSAETGEVGPDGTVVAKSSRPAPPVEEIAPHFPHLEILECLGRGGMGAVYKARQPKLDRFVALKILTRGHDPKISDTEFAARFQQEARALARITHPDIVAVYDFGEAGGYHYLLMEYVDGLTLRQLLQTHKLTPEQALSIVPKICEALQFAHERGIVHRDIKPENILLDKQGRVKIADFGIAKIVGTEAAASERGLTGAKDVIGTPHYMAPEQIEHPRTVDHRADIYSLGVVFYEMLTGELPLGKFQSPSRMVQVDVRLDEVVLHALEKNPDRRYQHASEVKKDVETIAATSPAPAAVGKAPIPVQIKGWRDYWPWDTSYICLYLCVPLPVSGFLPFLFPEAGLKAFAFAPIPLLVGAGFAATYAVIGYRIRRLKAALPQPAGEVAECLMFRRPFQAPGLAVLYEDRLELIPIVKSPITVILEDIVAISEVRWFNGTRLWWKKGFELELANGQRIGVAVAESLARRWRSRLSRGSLPELPAESEIRGAPSETAAGAATSRWVTAVRWTARVLGTLWLLLFGVMIIGEGMPAIGSQPAGVQLGFAALGLSFLGIIIGWKREGVGALLVALGWTAWHAPQGRFGLNLFQIPLLVALLYGYCWWATCGRRTGVVLGTVAGFAALLGLGGAFAPTNVFVRGMVIDAQTGQPIPNAEVRLLPRARHLPAKGDQPEARTDKKGRFNLYVGWYSEARELAISATNYTYATLTTNLGPRILGQRNVKRDFQLQPLSSAILPYIGLERVSLRDAIQHLAKVAKWNVVFDPELERDGTGPNGRAYVDSEVNLHWENVTGEAALNTLLKNFGLRALADSTTGIRRITKGDSSKPGQLEKPSAAFDAALAVALFNEIEDFGHEFDAAFTSRNLAAAQAGVGRLLNLLSNFNEVVRGMDLGFPPATLDDVAKVGQALDEGDWEKARRLGQHNEEYARAFKRIGGRMVELARKQREQVRSGGVVGSLASVPPVVVETVPISGAMDVDSSLIELRVTFSKPMRDGSCSWVQLDEASFPLMTGQPRFSADRLTCVLPVKLQPGKVYATWINVDNFQNFQDESGRPALPYLLVFETRKSK